MDRPEIPSIKLVAAAATLASVRAWLSWHAVISRWNKMCLGQCGGLGAGGELGMRNLIPVHEALLRRAVLVVFAARELFIWTADIVHTWRRRTKLGSVRCGPTTATC